MDADADVVSGAMYVVRVGAGKAAIARVTAGFPAVVRIPVVSGVVFSNDCTEVLAVSCVSFSCVTNLTRADSLIVNLNIFFL